MIVRVQDDMREGVGELIKALFKASGARAIAVALNRWYCGKGVSGHHYQVVCLGADELGTWALDPFTECIKCGTPMSEDAYNKMVIAYTDMVGEYQSEEDLW